MNNTLNKKQTELLQEKSHEELIGIIYALIDNNKQAKSVLSNCYLLSPEEILKNIDREYNKRAKSKKYYDYHEADEFFEDLRINVVQLFSKVIHEFPEQSEEFLMKMIFDMEKLSETKDTSSGVWMNYYSEIIDLWTKSLGEHKNSDANYIAKKIMHLYEKEQYFGMEIFNYCKSALNWEVLRALRDLFDHNNKKSEALYVSMLIMDIEYFRAAMQNEEFCHPQHYLDYAKLLIDDVRADAAINVLTNAPKKISFNSNLELERNKLLIRAMFEEGRSADAKECCIDAFKKTCHSDFYTLYNGNKVGSKGTTDIFLEIVKQKGHEHYLAFIMSIERFDLIDNYIINYSPKNLSELLESFSGSFIRRMSSELFKHGHAMSATALRRYLVERALQTAQSKYYRYAVSDLKKSIDYSLGLQNDASLVGTQVYLELLYKTHKRKVSFWPLVREKITGISISKDRISYQKDSSIQS